MGVIVKIFTLWCPREACLQLGKDETGLVICMRKQDMKSHEGLAYPSSEALQP